MKTSHLSFELKIVIRANLLIIKRRHDKTFYLIKITITSLTNALIHSLISLFRKKKGKQNAMSCVFSFSNIH